MKLILIGVTLFGVGCAPKKPVKVGVNYSLDPQYVSKIELQNCDSSEPPKCQKIIVDYKAGTEQLEVK